MLCEIYRGLGLQGDIGPKFVLSTIFGGHLWALKMEHPVLFAVEDDDPSTVSETFDILEMWSLIEGAYERLSDDEKKQVKEETGFGTFLQNDNEGLEPTSDAERARLVRTGRCCRRTSSSANSE